jgi:phosphoribosylamine--glycine ligase
MTSDLVDVLEGASPEWMDMATVNVVLAAKGYPTAPEKGAVIKGLDRVPDDVIVFHAGTRRKDGILLVDGGRVLNLVGTGGSIGVAREAAYEAANVVAWPGVELRTDIAG